MGVRRRRRSPPSVLSPARTVTWNWAVGANPLVTSITDANGTITTTVDLLGRPVSYTDVWAKTTTTSYDQPGRVSSVVGPQGTVAFTYDAAGRIATQTLDGVDSRDPDLHNRRSELATVAYSNNTSLATITRNPAGAVTGLTFNTGASLLTSDTVTRHAVRPDRGRGDRRRRRRRRQPELRLRRRRTAHLGQSPRAHNHVRVRLDREDAVCSQPQVRTRTELTKWTTAPQRPTATTTRIGLPVPPASPPSATTVTPARSRSGQPRSHTTVETAAPQLPLARQPTGTYAMPSVELSRSNKAPQRSPATRYSGPGDAPAAVLDASSVVIDRLVGLSGGVSIRKRIGADFWAYSNMHGDTTALANSTGAKQGATRTYDPYGQSLAGTPDTYTGPLDPGWLGGPQRLTDTTNTIIQMGARPVRAEPRKVSRG